MCYETAFVNDQNSLYWQRFEVSLVIVVRFFSNQRFNFGGI